MARLGAGAGPRCYARRPPAMKVVVTAEYHYVATLDAENATTTIGKTVVEV